MLKYRTRPGVVLTSICGEYLLVSAKANLDVCHYVGRINESSAFLWGKLKDGATEADLIEAVKAEYEVEDADALRGIIGDFIKQMTELNYLLPEEIDPKENGDIDEE